MIPDPRIIENIKKLKDLGMSKEDIKNNLIKMNLSSEDCEALIAATENDTTETAIPEEDKTKTAQSLSKTGSKKTKAKKKTTKDEGEPEEKEPETTEETDTSKPESDKELPDNLFDENTDIEASKEEGTFDIKEITKEAADITKGLDIEQLDYSKNLSDTDTSKNLDTNQNVWGAGIATTINSKLNEIDLKQAKYEEYIKKRLAEEVDKFKKIQDTSKHLLISKIDEEVSDRTSTINTQLTKQLAQIKIELVKINKKSEEMTSGKTEVEELIKNLQTTQAQVVENNNRSQDNINKMVASISVKLNAKMKEINDILSLQSKITQGLIKNTQTTIGDEIKKLEEFKEELSNKVNPQQMYDKLNQLETFKQQLANRYETRFENVRNEFLIKAKEAFKDEIDTELKEIKNVKENILAKTDPELITKKLEELESFQSHLISAIDEKISQSLKIYESAMNQEIKSKAKSIDEEVNKVETAIVKLEEIEEKINEIDKFKEQFIAIIDKNIEKMNNTSSQLDKKMKEIEEKQKMMI